MDEKTRKTLMSSDKMNWETPKFLFDKFNEKFHYDLDVWASEQNALCENYFTEQNSAIGKVWSNGSNCGFGNPPYGRFISEALDEHYFQYKNYGFPSSVLFSSRTDTKYFHKHFNHCSDVYFLQGRLTFNLNGKPVLNPKTGKADPAPFPSIVFHFGQYDINQTKPRIHLIKISDLKNKDFKL